MQNLLIISEADSPIAARASSLQRAGYAVACSTLDAGPVANAMERLLEAFQGQPPDCLLVDLSTTSDCLAMQQARRVLRYVWGEDFPSPPCLAALCARHLVRADWLAYADDFLLPPYALEEMLARLAQLMFRKRHIEPGNTLTFADVTLDMASNEAFDAAARPLPLTPREYDLLQFLATHRGRFYARDRLLDLVWGVEFEGSERTVDIHIRRLRAKLPSQAAVLLETRRGVGYGFRTSLNP